MRTLGDQELDLLRFVSDNEPITVADVAQKYGETGGLARTTVLTMMERLRKKGYLVRSKQDGAFLYQTVESTRQVMSEVVGNFVKNTLGGTVSPFIAFLTESQSLAPDEVDALRALLNKLERRDAE
jgi:predicted transcriptional regulator